MDATEPKEVAALAEEGALPADANKPIEKIPFYVDPSSFDSVEGMDALVCRLQDFEGSEFVLLDEVPRTKLVIHIDQLQKQVATDAKLVGKLKAQITDLELELQESKHRELDLKKKLHKVRFYGRNRAEPNSIAANQPSGKASKGGRPKKAPAASRTTAKGEGLKTRSKESSWMLA